MKFETDLSFWTTVSWIGPIIGALIGGIISVTALYKKDQLEKQIKINEQINQEKSESIRRQNAQKDKEEIIQSISKDNNYIYDKDFPGYAVSFLIKLEKIPEKRRKFIFDSGENLERNRVSIYLDSDNNLIYRIIDQEGESHSIKIPSKVYTFQMNTWYYIYFDYGYTNLESFMRLYINDKEVGRNIFKYPINIPEKLDFKNTSLIGVDKNKKDFGGFTLAFLACMKSTLSQNQRDSMMRDVIEFKEATGEL